MHGEREGMSFGKKANLAFNLVTSAGHLWMLAGAKRPGERLVKNPNSLWSLGILMLFAGLGNSVVLQSYVLPAAVFVFLVQAAGVRKPDRTRHSFGIGPCVLGDSHGAWLLWALVAMAAGAVLCRTDKAAGFWFLLSGVGLVVGLGAARSKQAAVDQDLADAQIEARARAERMGRF